MVKLIPYGRVLFKILEVTLLVSTIRSFHTNRSLIILHRTERHWIPF